MSDIDTDGGGGETIEFDYVEGGQGPGITELPAGSAADPDTTAAAAAAAEPAILWDQETVEQFLRGTGEGIHMLAGVGEQDWKMTERDLARIAPPLTRIANRYEPVLKLAPVADPLLVAHGFALYGWRSALERQRAIRDAQIQQRQRDGYDVVGHDPDLEQPEADTESEEPDIDVEGGAAYFPDSPRARSTST